MKNLLQIFCCLLLSFTVSARSIGFVKIESPFSNNDTIKIQEYFRTIITTLGNKKNYSPVYLTDKMNYDSVDKKYITQKCNEYSLDGIVLSRMKIVVQPTSITDEGRKLYKTGHSYVEMAYFDKDGHRMIGAEYYTNHASFYITANQIKTLKSAISACTRQLLRMVRLEYNLRSHKR